jgi:hypothetical protein
MIEIPAETSALNADSGGRISLRIRIDEEDSMR